MPITPTTPLNGNVSTTNALVPCNGNIVVTAVFLVHLPRFEKHARFAFRRVRCPHDRAEQVAEAVALAWKHFTELSGRGKKPETFVATLAMRCTQAVKAGRKLAGCESSTEVLSPVAQVRHGFAVMRLREREPVLGHPALPGELTEALADNTKSAVPEQAAFRVDFPRWRSTLRRRDRKVLDALAAGERTLDAARRFHISEARVSQLRRVFEEGWRRFEGN